MSDDELKHLSQAHLDQAKGFATAVLLVAGATLSLSITVFTKMGASQDSTLVGVVWLKVSWVLLGVTMLAEVFTILASMHAIRGTIETGEYVTRWAKITECLNWLVGALLTLGFAGLLAFAFQNVG